MGSLLRSYTKIAYMVSLDKRLHRVNDMFFLEEIISINKGTNFDYKLPSAGADDNLHYLR